MLSAFKDGIKIQNCPETSVPEVNSVEFITQA